MPMRISPPAHARPARPRALLLLATLLAWGTPATAQEAPVPPGRLIDLGGYRLHLDCRGHGTPTVVLSAGAGDFSFDWALVQPAVAQVTRVCAYDRAGEAWSELGPRPRTLDQEVFDLERLLARAGERGPFLLVGQSLGGMVARLFASRYPGETAGLVLVDAFSEDAQLFMNGKLVRIRDAARARPIPAPRDQVAAADSLGATERQKIAEFVGQIGPPKIDPPFDRLPAAVQRERLWALAQITHFAGGDDYLAEIAARVHAETAAAPYPLRDVPLIVLERTRDEYPPAQAAVLSAEHREQQRRMAQLSRAGSLVLVPGAGHHIQLDEPGAVIEAIRKMVARNRQKGATAGAAGS